MTALHVQILEPGTAPLPVFTTLRFHNRHAQETR
jgi:hypothetical protein